MVKYYHSDCGGSIGVIGRKCSKCGKRWPISILFKYPLPPEIYMAKKGGLRLKRKVTSYSKWANRYPKVGEFAGRLPNWPRWARILSFLAFLGVLGYISYLLWGLVKWILP